MLEPTASAYRNPLRLDTRLRSIDPMRPLDPYECDSITTSHAIHVSRRFLETKPNVSYADLMAIHTLGALISRRNQVSAHKEALEQRLEQATMRTRNRCIEIRAESELTFMQRMELEPAD
jgi:hypothetical protein